MPPTSSGNSPARLDVGDGFRRIAHELPRGVDRIRIHQVEQVVAYRRARRRIRLGAADVEAAIHLRRIDANYLDGELARESQRDVALARCRSAP